MGELAVALRCAIAVAFGQGVGDSDDSGADRERSWQSLERQKEAEEKPTSESATDRRPPTNQTRSEPAAIKQRTHRVPNRDPSEDWPRPAAAQGGSASRPGASQRAKRSS